MLNIENLHVATLDGKKIPAESVGKLQTNRPTTKHRIHLHTYERSICM